MKRFIAIIVAMLTVIACSLFTACGGGVEGNYRLDTLNMDGVVYKVGNNVPEIGELKEDTFVVVVNADNTFTFTENIENRDPLVVSGQWYQKAGTDNWYVIIVDVDDEPQSSEVLIENGTIVVDFGGTMSFIFKKS